MSHRIILALAVFLIPLSVHAQEKYTIKLKEYAEGDSVKYDIKSSTTSKDSTKFNKEKDAKTSEFKRANQFTYTDTIVEKAADSPLPTKVKRVYDKALTTNAKENVKEERTAAYNGKTLIIEKKKEGYEVRFDGGAVLPGSDAPELYQEFSQNERDKSKSVFLPKGPVALNESWKINPNSLIGDPDKKVNTEVIKSEGTAKLIKVYKKDGHQFGVIEIVAEVQVKSVFKGQNAGDTGTAEMKGNLKITFDGCIDGTLAAGRMNGTFEFNGIQSQSLQGTTSNSTSSGSHVVDETWQELGKKT